MLVRFQGDDIITQEGDIVNVSYAELREACLESSYTSPSIVTIVSEALEKITGYSLNRYKCRESPLFARLENDIRNDKRYQEEKQSCINKKKEIHDAKEKERCVRINRDFFNKSANNRLRKYYTWRP